MSPTTFLFLHENGYIEDDDVRGTMKLKVNGSNVKGVSFVIKKLKINDLVITNAPAVLLKNQTVPLLIGSSAFDGFGNVYDKTDHLVISWDDESAETVKNEEDPVNVLADKVQACFDAEDYAGAEVYMKELYDGGNLNMFTHYQYCMVLAMNNHDAENVAVSKDWINKYAGKAQSMDYWIYDGLGTSYLKLDDSANAIEWLTKAYNADCELFNTSEAEIKAGNFHDKSLGRTLFALSQAYGKTGNLSRSERWMSLAAKCGYQPAIDFCNQYKIK